MTRYRFSLSHIYAFVIILLTSGCGGKSTIKVINPYNSSENAYDLSITKVVALSNEEQAIIGEIATIWFSQTKIFVFDRIKNQGLCVFDNYGNYLWRTRIGKGPNELILPEGICITDSIVFVMDMNRIKRFNLDGEYLSTIVLPANFNIHFFNFINQDQIVTYGTSNTLNEKIKIIQERDSYKRYHIVNKDFKHQYDSEINVPTNLIPLECEHPFSKNNNKFLCVSALDNHIYGIEDGSFIKKFYVDFAERKIDKNEYEKGYNYVFGLILNQNRNGLIDNIYHVSNYLTFSYLASHGKNVQVLCSKQDLKTIDWSNLLAINDLPPLQPIGQINDQFVLEINPAIISNEELCKFKTKGIIPKSSTMDSNPILVYVSIKQQNKAL